MQHDEFKIDEEEKKQLFAMVLALSTPMPMSVSATAVDVRTSVPSCCLLYSRDLTGFAAPETMTEFL